MAGLAETDTIDVVAQDAAHDILLVIVETRRWGTDSAQPAQLRAKINAYTGFITDGSLLRKYPQAAGHKVFIQLNCLESPTGECAAIVDHASGKLTELGIGFRLNVRS